MKRITLLGLLLTLTALLAPAQYVTVSGGGFSLGGKPYRYVGTNLWYAHILAQPDGARGANRARLHAELDSLQALGIDNVRIMACGEAEKGLDCQVVPALQTAPGVYNDTLLLGLDYVLHELEQRQMKAIVFLANAWEWSGGYGAYLEWAGVKGPLGRQVLPNDGWQEFLDYNCQFVRNERAMQMTDQHIRRIVARTNSLTGKPYTQSPAIMAWELANEPRAFSDESKPALLEWVRRTSSLIKSLDRNHLVTTGSEGSAGCEEDIELWKQLHALPTIDYACIHLWPYNWKWVTRDSIWAGVDHVCEKSREYILEHARAAHAFRKPVVLEEFGYPRDGVAYTLSSTTAARNVFYDRVMRLANALPEFSGLNFWGWGGTAKPTSTQWHLGAPYTCDPAFEPQGYYSVFASDKGTCDIIRRWAHTMKNR